MPSQVSVWCSKAHPRSWLGLKGHTDSVDVSGGPGACPELNKTERKKIIQIYVFMYRCGVASKPAPKLHSWQPFTFQTGALDCDIIIFWPSINQKFDKYQKELQ